VSKHGLFAYLSVLSSGEGGEGIRRRYMCAGVGAIPSDVLQKNYQCYIVEFLAHTATIAHQWGHTSYFCHQISMCGGTYRF